MIEGPADRGASQKRPVASIRVRHRPASARTQRKQSIVRVKGATATGQGSRETGLKDWHQRLGGLESPAVAADWGARLAIDGPAATGQAMLQQHIISHNNMATSLSSSLSPSPVPSLIAPSSSSSAAVASLPNCSHFLHGNCLRGSSCPFPHTLTNSHNSNNINSTSTSQNTSTNTAGLTLDPLASPSSPLSALSPHHQGQASSSASPSPMLDSHGFFNYGGLLTPISPLSYGPQYSSTFANYSTASQAFSPLNAAFAMNFASSQQYPTGAFDYSTASATGPGGSPAYYSPITEGNAYSNNSSLAIPLCRDWQKGICNRSNCRFSHDPLPPLPLPAQMTQLQGQQASMNGGSIFFPRQFTPCRDFLQGKCHRGVECRYAHDSSPVCRDFQRGKCEREKNCRYKHLLEAGPEVVAFNGLPRANKGNRNYKTFGLTLSPPTQGRLEDTDSGTNSGSLDSLSASSAASASVSLAASLPSSSLASPAIFPQTAPSSAGLPESAQHSRSNSFSGPSAAEALKAQQTQ